MDISIDYGNTNIISIPISYLELVSANFYRLDTDQFRKDLRAIEESIEGATFPDTHRHNTEVNIGGVTIARVIEILPPYSIEFENGQYAVELIGSNNNISDIGGGILRQNQVQVISTNSAGLISPNLSLIETDIEKIIEGVWKYKLPPSGA